LIYAFEKKLRDVFLKMQCISKIHHSKSFLKGTQINFYLQIALYQLLLKKSPDLLPDRDC